MQNSESQNTSIEAVRRLAGWKGLEQIDAILQGARREPNFFKIAPRVLRVEGVHSDMLAWLLDPKGWHGLADGFARLLVNFVLQACERGSMESFVVREIHRECSTGQGPVDILVVIERAGVRFRVAIENKIDAPEGDDQIRRYAEGLTSRYGQNTFALVYLTPDGRAPRSSPDCNLMVMAYAEVANLLDGALAATTSTVQTTGRELVRHYVAALRMHIMTDSNPEIDRLCRILYLEHQEAWRAIRRRLPSERDESHSYIAEAVCRRLEADHKGQWVSVVRPDRYACLFRPAWRVLGASRAQQIVGLEHSASDEAIAKVHFRLVVDASDSDGDDSYQYKVRLKVGRAPDSQLGGAVIRALQALPHVQSRVPADRDEFTMLIKATSTLPGPGNEVSGVPDVVVDWFARQLSYIIPALDAVLPNE